MYIHRNLKKPTFLRGRKKIENTINHHRLIDSKRNPPLFKRESKKSSIRIVDIFFFLSFLNITRMSCTEIHQAPLDLSRDSTPRFSVQLSLSLSLSFSLFLPRLFDRIRWRMNLTCYVQARPGSIYHFLENCSRIAFFPLSRPIQRQMADTRLVHRYGTYSGLLEMAYAAQTSGSREIYFRDPRRFRRMFHTG